MALAICVGILLAVFIIKMTRLLPYIIIILFILWVIGSVSHSETRPPKPFSWDRYDDRQTACKMYYQAIQDCTKGNCNQTVIQELQRKCSAF